MGPSTREKCLLKLVHPGRHIEYHKTSVTAGEIMRKNPRHSITRPDFFKNPDIVVHPESVMVPGQVFYIVPNTTVHRLIKNKAQQLNNQPSPQQTMLPNTSDYKHASKETSPCKLWAGTTPMYHLHQEQQGSVSCPKSRHEAEEDDLLDDSLTLTFQAKDYYLNGNKSEWGITSNSDQQQTRNDKQVKKLKSCMKKEGCIRTSPNLRVTFDFSSMIQY